MIHVSPTVTLVPAMRDGKRGASVSISRVRAEILVARGQAVWDGLNRILERYMRPRGQQLEWRKTTCYDPGTRSSMPTMQLVPAGKPRGRRVSHASASVPVHSTSTPYGHPFALGPIQPPAPAAIHKITQQKLV